MTENDRQQKNWWSFNPLTDLAWLENNCMRHTITLDADYIENTCNALYESKKARIKVPGFKPGNVPRKIIEKVYGQSYFYDSAIRSLAFEAHEEIMSRYGLSIIGIPIIEDVKHKPGNPAVVMILSVKREVELWNYRESYNLYMTAESRWNHILEKSKANQISTCIPFLKEAYKLAYQHEGKSLEKVCEENNMTLKECWEQIFSDEELKLIREDIIKQVFCEKENIEKTDSAIIDKLNAIFTYSNNRIGISKERKKMFSDIRLLTSIEAKKIDPSIRRYRKKWWIEDVGKSTKTDIMRCIVNESGDVLYREFICTCPLCVRPVLVIRDKESFPYAIGEEFIFGFKRFVRLNQEIAFCLEDIGFSVYALRTNSGRDVYYKRSEIEEMLNNWFEAALAIEETNQSLEDLYRDESADGIRRASYLGNQTAKKKYAEYVFDKVSEQKSLLLLITAEEKLCEKCLLRGIHLDDLSVLLDSEDKSVVYRYAKWEYERYLRKQDHNRSYTKALYDIEEVFYHPQRKKELELTKIEKDFKDPGINGILAKKACQKAAELGIEEMQDIMITQFLDCCDCDNFKKWVDSAVSRGNGKVLHMVAFDKNAYGYGYYGNGTKRLKKSVENYIELAGRGDSVALLKLSECSAKAIGMDKNVKLAFDLLLSAANRGNAYALELKKTIIDYNENRDTSIIAFKEYYDKYAQLYESNKISEYEYIFFIGIMGTLSERLIEYGQKRDSDSKKAVYQCMNQMNNYIYGTVIDRNDYNKLVDMINSFVSN